MIDQFLETLGGNTVGYILLFGISFMVLWLLASTTRSYRAYRKATKDYEQRLGELEEKKCNGPHKWLKMNVDGVKSHVCQDCCWCPDHEAYVKEIYVKAELEAIEFRKNLEIYREERLDEIAEKYSVSSEKIREIAEEVTRIKQDFAVEHLGNIIENIGNK
jgi:DNA repair exonuclease SbcCD ATPase subunit